MRKASEKLFFFDQPSVYLNEEKKGEEAVKAVYLRSLKKQIEAKEIEKRMERLNKSKNREAISRDVVDEKMNELNVKVQELKIKASYQRLLRQQVRK